MVARASRSSAPRRKPSRRPFHTASTARWKARRTMYRRRRLLRYWRSSSGKRNSLHYRTEMSTTNYTIEPIGVIRSTLTSREEAPLQGDEGAPAAWLELIPQVAPGLVGIAVGDRLVVLTWLHQ